MAKSTRLDISGGLDIGGLINGYAAEVIDENIDAAAENARESAEKAKTLLRAESRERTGAYKSGWKVSMKRGANFVDCYVHNRIYQLTHLLEKGHVITNQTGRIYGHVPGDGVIKSVAERTAAEFGMKGGKGS